MAGPDRSGDRTGCRCRTAAGLRPPHTPHSSLGAHPTELVKYTVTLRKLQYALLEIKCYSKSPVGNHELPGTIQQRLVVKAEARWNQKVIKVAEKSIWGPKRSTYCTTR